MSGSPPLPTRSPGDGGWPGRVVSLRTMTIPPSTATDDQVEEVRRRSLARYGIPYAEAEQNVRETLGADFQEASLDRVVPPYEVVAA